MAGRREKCSVCPSKGLLEWVTVRVYRKRSQVEFRYHVCQDCIRVLAAFLEGGAVAVQRGLFSLNEERQVQQVARRTYPNAASST
jgi:hypothetical protein